jgi:male germ cell-associated kinase
MKKKYTIWEECINLKEVKALVELRHPNIVTLQELVLSEENELNMIFEYIGINLYEYMTKQDREISEIKIRNIIFQVLQGLAHMHKENFFHRDMKPENILINDDNVKIADFGLAKEVKIKPPFTDYVATRWYRSPEVILKSRSYNSPIDIFAVGAIMAELYNNKPLFPGKSEFEQMSKICEVLGTPSQMDWTEGYVLAGKINYKFPNCKGQKLKNLIPRANDNAINLLESMLSFNPMKRPTAAQCLQHPFFQCFDILSFYGLKPVINKLSSSSVNSSLNGVSVTPIRLTTQAQNQTHTEHSKYKTSGIISNHGNFQNNSKKNSIGGISDNLLTSTTFTTGSTGNVFSLMNSGLGKGGIGLQPSHASSNSQVSKHFHTKDTKEKNIIPDLFSNHKLNLNITNKTQKVKFEDFFHI